MFLYYVRIRLCMYVRKGTFLIVQNKHCRLSILTKTILVKPSNNNNNNKIYNYNNMTAYIAPSSWIKNN